MLEGYRILGLTSQWAGPMALRPLAELGAEVIKIEATRRPDPTRGPKQGHPTRRDYPEDDPGADPWNRATRFNDRNLAMMGLAIDLTTTDGKNIFMDLVRQSDVVVENFSPRVMRNWGLEYATLRAVKPDIVMVSMPGFGHGGPWQDYVSYGPTLEYISGLSSLTGYDPEDARLTGIIAPDPLSALHGTAAVLSGLHYRNSSGEGSYLELAQLESTLCLIGDKLLHAETTGTNATPMGNKHPQFAPHGAYPCRGAVGAEDAWVTIAVTSDEEWQRLSDIAGQSLALEQFTTMAGRKAHEAELDQLIAAWTRRLDKYHVTHLLQRAGIAAAPVLTSREHFGDPQVLDRQMLVPVDHPSTGLRTYLAMAWRDPATVANGAARSVRAAPTLGQHNRHILHDILGMSVEAIDQLAAHGVIGTEPD
jgi:crotonobetainyl-CoA:carnitine CoA-transferase CaiB-like acyl-CoA transferase